MESNVKNQAVSELYTKRKWIGQAAGEAALLVTSKAFKGEGEFLRVVLPLMVPLLKGKDGSTLQVRQKEIRKETARSSILNFYFLWIFGRKAGKENLSLSVGEYG